MIVKEDINVCLRLSITTIHILATNIHELKVLHTGAGFIVHQEGGQIKHKMYYIYTYNMDVSLYC